MTNEFNKIKDAYQSNLFKQVDEQADILSLYRSLPDLDITGDTEEGLYHLAARFADAEAISFLIESNLTPRTDKYGNTALHALINTKFDLKQPETAADRIYNSAKLLLDAGLNPKKKNDAGKLAYYEAGLLYLYPLIDALGDAGTKMDATAEEGKNLLHAICDKLVHRKTIPGAVEAATKTISILLEKGSIDPEDKDIFGTMPLTYAQRSGVKEIAAILSGEEGDAVTGGMTLHEAILNRDTAAASALIGSGTGLNDLSDQHNRTPLMLACEYPSEPLVQLLARGGADVNYRAGNGETAVYYLISKGIYNFGRGMSQDLKDVVKILRLLIEAGLDLNASINNEGDTALNMICQAGYLADLNYALAEELIDARCDLNQPNIYGRTPLMSYASRGNEMKFSITELLLDNDADSTYADQTGSTALMYAASNSDHASAKKMVSLLIEKDASPLEKVNNNGQTAMDLAIQSNNEAVVKQLIA